MCKKKWKNCADNSRRMVVRNELEGDDETLRQSLLRLLLRG